MKKIIAIIMLVALCGASFAATAGCDVALSFGDWRVVSAIGLFIAAALISIMYMYGSVIDSSFISRAKNELFQLSISVILLLLFTAIVGFMCSNIVAQIFQVQSGDSFTAGYNYLTLLSGYLQKELVAVAIFTTSVNSLGAIKTTGMGSLGDLVKGVSSNIGFMDTSISAFFAVLLTSYLATLTQMQIMNFLPIMCLNFFIPIGLVLRCIFPFRKFGGALLGTGIALYIAVPFLLLLNQTLMYTYITDPVLNPTNCTQSSDCYSTMCVNSSCIPMKSDFDTCNNNYQCASGYCIQSSSVTKCNPCGVLGDNNQNCCQGFMWDGFKCISAKNLGDTCTNNSQCSSWECENGVCMSKKAVGANCDSNDQCASRYCSGVTPNGVCAETIMTDTDQSFITANQLAAISASNPTEAFNVGVSQNTVTYVSSSDVISTANQMKSSYSTTMLSGMFKLYSLVVGSLIAGILLPLLDVAVISRAVKDMSVFFGEEIDISTFWRVI